MSNQEQGKAISPAKRDTILIGILVVLYLIPGIILALDGINPFNWYAQAVFIAVDDKLAAILSVLATIFGFSLLIASRNIWYKVMGFLGILLPLYVLSILLPYYLS